MQGNTFQCRGQAMPLEQASSWDCSNDDDGRIVCERDGRSYYPSTSAGGSHNCYYDRGFIVCEVFSGGGSQPPPDGGIGPVPGSSISDDSGRPEPDSGGQREPEDDGGGAPEDDGGSQVPPGCVCVPGAVRYCDTPWFCNWGIQTCRSNGWGWSSCLETRSPSPCGYDRGQYTERSQQCCVESGYCCQDYHDLDGDGDRLESVGNCEEPVCR